MKVAHQIAQFMGRQEWLRLGLRRRIVRFLAPPLSIEAFPFETVFRGGRYRGNAANMQEWHILFFGGYELRELTLMQDILKYHENPVACDIGGNLGNHSLVMARFAERVHTFEPYGPLADRIEAQIALNGYTNVSLHRVGLGEEPRALEYFLDLASRNQGTGSFLPDHSEGEAVAVLDVVRGDEFLGSRIQRLDFVKIDVEGFEAPALAGLRRTLMEHKPTIMMEVTESSFKMFQERGGYRSLLPFPFEIYRVANPSYPFGLFQKSDYRLEKLTDIVPERQSFNVLIVPDSRRQLFGRLLSS